MERSYKGRRKPQVKDFDNDSDSNWLPDVDNEQIYTNNNTYKANHNHNNESIVIDDDNVPAMYKDSFTSDSKLNKVVETETFFNEKLAREEQPTLEMGYYDPSVLGSKLIKGAPVPELYCDPAVNDLKDNQLPDNMSLKTFLTYWGTSPEDTMNQFCHDIISISERVYKYYCYDAPMKMTFDQQRIWKLAWYCYICRRPFGFNGKKCADHDHITGDFLGATCNTCNLTRVLKYTELPLIFHNAKGYDLHHVIKEVTKRKYHCTFNGIAQNSEKIMSFTIKKPLLVRDDGTPTYERSMCDIKIIDSLLFLLKSLESLTDILKRHSKDPRKCFPVLYTTLQETRYFTDERIEALIQKNLYPYLWLDSFEKFNRPITELIELVRKNEYKAFTDTPDEAFAANFEKKKASFFNILGKFELERVIDYADLYLKCDVLQLADIIQFARKTFFDTHHLDMIRYFGAPGYSWDAFLYYLQREDVLKPDLFKADEMNMVCFFMQCIRGGCSGIMKRFSQANTPMIANKYDPSKPTKYILYLDANNLYGWAMSQPLPYKGSHWIDSMTLGNLNCHAMQDELDEYLEYLPKYQMGAFLEVKLEYPQELHDAHNLYPLAPERRCIKASEVSYFTKNLHDILNVRINTKTPLLLQTLEDKDHYFVYYKNLKLYRDLGLKVTKIYGGVEFSEAPIMKGYIELNTRLRNQRGASDFERELYKLMNNSIYGKTLENPMKYSILQFISNERQLNKAVAKPGFDGSIFTQDNFAIVKMKYETVKYEKPLYIGATVTELAKWKMFDFYYNVLQDYFRGPKKCELLFTDTDSLMLEITTENIFADIAAINAEPRYHCPIDVSTFNPEIVKQYHIKTTNNKVIGAFKSETGSELIAEFVGLRAKMYSFIVDGSENNKHLKAKGVARSSLNLLSHQNYLDCLFHPENPSLARQEIEMKSIRSKQHELQSVKATKFGLSCNDTKRYIIPDRPYIYTLAFGHKDIPSHEKAFQQPPSPPPPSAQPTPAAQPAATTSVPFSADPPQPPQPTVHLPPPPPPSPPSADEPITIPPPPPSIDIETPATTTTTTSSSADPPHLPQPLPPSPPRPSVVKPNNILSPPSTSFEIPTSVVTKKVEIPTSTVTTIFDEEPPKKKGRPIKFVFPK